MRNKHIKMHIQFFLFINPFAVDVKSHDHIAIQMLSLS